MGSYCVEAFSLNVEWESLRARRKNLSFINRCSETWPWGCSRSQEWDPAWCQFKVVMKQSPVTSPRMFFLYSELQMWQLAIWNSLVSTSLFPCFCHSLHSALRSVWCQVSSNLGVRWPGWQFSVLHPPFWASLCPSVKWESWSRWWVEIDNIYKDHNT